MISHRRGFLGLFTGALASAPGLGRELAEKMSGSTGLGRTGAFAALARDIGEDMSAVSFDSEADVGDDPSTGESPRSRRKNRLFGQIWHRSHDQARLQMLKRYGPEPSHVINAQDFAEAEASRCLPPHIAALRSFSAQAKHREAVRYYFERELRRQILRSITGSQQEYQDHLSTIQDRLSDSMHTRIGALFASDKGVDVAPEEGVGSDKRYRRRKSMIRAAQNNMRGRA